MRAGITGRTQEGLTGGACKTFPPPGPGAQGGQDSAPPSHRTVVHPAASQQRPVNLPATSTDRISPSSKPHIRYAGVKTQRDAGSSPRSPHSRPWSTWHCPPYQERGAVGRTEELLQSLLVRSGPGEAQREEGVMLAVRETGLGGEGAGKKGINPINPNLEALPASLKYREFGRVESWALLAGTQDREAFCRRRPHQLSLSTPPPQTFPLPAELRGAVGSQGGPVFGSERCWARFRVT